MSELILPFTYCNAHFIWKQAGSKGFQTFAMAFHTDDVTANLDQMALDIGDDWFAAYGAANILDSYTLVGVNVYRGPDAQLAVGRATMSHQGSASGAPLPVNVSLLIKKNTALAGVAFRGRMYSPALQIAETLVNGVGVIDPTARTNTNARYALAWNAMLAVDGVDEFVLLHGVPKEGDVPDPTPLTSIVLDGTVATQRRRLR